MQYASLSQRGVEQIAPLTSPCSPGYLVFLQSRYVVLLGSVSSSSALSEPIIGISGARARGQLSSSAIIVDNVLPDAGAVFISAAGQETFRNLDGLRAALARLGPSPPVTVRLRQRGAVVLRAGGRASAGRDLWLALSGERVAGVIAAVLHRVIAVELHWTRLVGMQWLRTRMVVGDGRLCHGAAGCVPHTCSPIGAPRYGGLSAQHGRGAVAQQGPRRSGGDGGPPRLIWDALGGPEQSPAATGFFFFLGVRFRMRITPRPFGSARANRPSVEWVAQIVWPVHEAADLVLGQRREDPQGGGRRVPQQRDRRCSRSKARENPDTGRGTRGQAGSEFNAPYRPARPASSRGTSLGAAGRQGSSDLQQREVPARMGHVEPASTEEYQPPEPYAARDIFAWRRDRASGNEVAPAAVSGDWCGQHPLEKYQIRMEWWYLTPGQRVFGVVMGRHPGMADQRSYPVHPSRYTVATSDNVRGGWDRQFDWYIDLDGVRIRLEGGEFVEATHSWHVFCREGEALRMHNSFLGPSTVFHPDSPVWGPGEEWSLYGPAQAAPTHYFIPPVDCPGTPWCDGGMREGVWCDHRVAQHAPVSLCLWERLDGRDASRAQAVGAPAGVQGSTWPRGITSAQGFRVPIAQLGMPGQRKRKARQAAEDEVAETDIAVYDHSAAAADVVATDLQQAVRDMVVYRLQPETVASIKFSKAGFPTLTSMKALAEDRVFEALGPELCHRLLHDESPQTAVERGDGRFPAVRVKDADERLPSVARLAAVWDESMGPAQLEASTRAGYQTAWRLVVTWGIAHKNLKGLLPMSKDTIKALTQELLMVGCAAGTIRNVWSSIADRHRRFGLPFPFSAPGEFSRMCKAVAAVVGTPSLIIFPIGAHHVKELLGAIGLTDEQERNALMTASGTVLSSRVVEITFFQPCDFEWEIDRHFHPRYEGTTAVHVYRRKQDTGRRGLWPRIGKSQRAEWDIVDRLRRHAEKYGLEVSPQCTKKKYPGAQCRHCGFFFFREKRIKKGEVSAERVQMTRQQVTNAVKSSLQLIGVDTTYFSGLSMRRGGISASITAKVQAPVLYLQSGHGSKNAAHNYVVPKDPSVWYESFAAFGL